MGMRITVAALAILPEQFRWIFDRTMQCVTEPGHCLTTVQFWVAVGSGTALVIGSTRWAVMKLRKTTVEDRLQRIEAQAEAPTNQRRMSDCEIVASHRMLFARPAFSRYCLQEISILLLSDVVNETIAALGTGALYDSKGLKRAEFPTRNRYTNSINKTEIEAIYRYLQDLQLLLRDLDVFLRETPGTHYPDGREFISVGLRKRVAPEAWQEILMKCDQIDGTRNEILGAFNKMLQNCSEPPLPLIRLSSTYVQP
jgi:hypothetical protein